VTSIEKDVSESTGDTVDLPAAAGQHQRAPLRRGMSVGRYILIDAVGEGGMGVVYRAYDPELERSVALKLLHAGVDGSSPQSTRRERLLREAKALARLSHPNVLAVYDVGTFEQDVFIATEFIEGPTLSEWIKQETRTHAEKVRAFAAAGDGLAAAHRAGLVHRDFKPSNVMVGKDGRIRVLDFGLARSEPAMGVSIPPVAVKHVSPDEDTRGLTMPASPQSKRDGQPLPPMEASAVRPPSIAGAPGDALVPPASPSSGSLSTGSSSGSGLLDMTITEFGQILGTPRFMAPEQHLGRTADARSDQFSFCVSLYEALYGEFPFEGRGEDYSKNVIQGRVRPPPAGTDVPSWLRRTLLRGLAVAPAERHPSMDALLTELRRDPTAARKRWLAVGGAVVATVAVLLGARHARPTPDPPCRGAEAKLAGIWDDPRKQAVREAFAATKAPGAEEAYARTAAALDDYARRWVSVHTDACEATRVRGEQSADLLDLRVECLTQRLGDLRAQVDVYTHADDRLVDRAVQAALALPRLEGCNDTASLRAPIRPPSEAAKARVEAVRGDIARAKALQRSARYSDALPIATHANDDAAALAYAPLTAETLYLVGDLQDDLGEYADAEHTLRRSVAAAMTGHHEAMEARALTGLVSEIGLRETRVAEAHEWALLAQAAVDRVSDPFIRGELARNIGRLFMREGKAKESGEAIATCLAIWVPALGADDYGVAGAVTDMGNVSLMRGEYEQGIAQYTRSLAILEKLMGPNSPLLGANLNNIGEAYASLGEWARALPPMERATEVWRQLGPEHPKVALGLNNVARARLHLGELAQAATLADQALAIWTKALGPDHPDVALGLHVVAEVAQARGELDRALAVEEKALAIREKTFGPKNDDVAQSLTSIGETRLLQKKTTPAAAAFERAAGILGADPDAEPLPLADARFGLAQALAPTDAKRAKELAAQARAAFAAAKGPIGAERTAKVDAWTASLTH
jgi:serine/threonine protein kinase/tetratricopeptide (TPR) repeat protein